VVEKNHSQREPQRQQRERLQFIENPHGRSFLGEAL
jgi:hypothetical protein